MLHLASSTCRQSQVDELLLVHFIRVLRVRIVSVLDSQKMQIVAEDAFSGRDGKNLCILNKMR